MGSFQSRFIEWRRMGHVAANDGDLDALKDVESCNDIEAAYLAACEFQPINRLRSTTAQNIESQNAWKQILGFYWPEVVEFCSTSSLDEFASRLATSDRFPRQIMNLELANVAASLGIKLSDAAIVKGVLKMYFNKTVPIRSNIHFGMPEHYDLIRFIKPHNPSTDYMSTIIATNGAKSVLASEHDIHNAIMIPTGYFLAQMMSTVFSRLKENTENQYISTAEDVNIGACMLALCLLASSLFMSITALIVGSPNRLDDYTACRYLAIRWWLRFMDVILFLITITTLIPIASLSVMWSPFGSTKRPHHFFYMFIIAYFPCLASALFLFFSGGLRMISSYAVGEKKRRLGNWLAPNGRTGKYMEAMGQYRKGKMQTNWKKSIQDAIASIYAESNSSVSEERPGQITGISLEIPRHRQDMPIPTHSVSPLLPLPSSSSESS